MTEPQSELRHQPVLLAEVVSALRPERGGSFLDCTLGLGGHAEAILSASENARVIGLDADAESLQQATERLKAFGGRFIGIHSNFKELETVLGKLGIKSVQGIVADLGISSYQLGAPDRGFSFQHDAPLDARMDRSKGETAADLVNSLEESELADLIYQYGEEKGSRKIARLIVKERATHPIETTAELANIVVRALRVKGHWRIHPATRTFQGLRIAVNKEIEGLGEFVSSAISCLEVGARLAVISFHSLEDRVVKTAFRLESGICQCQGRMKDMPIETRGLEAQATTPLESNVVCRRCGARKLVTLLTRKPIQPSAQEIEANPRSRSARLRVCERVA